jgi:hypothetical protein
VGERLEKVLRRRFAREVKEEARRVRRDKKKSRAEKGRDELERMRRGAEAEIR